MSHHSRGLHKEQPLFPQNNLNFSQMAHTVLCIYQGSKVWAISEHSFFSESHRRSNKISFYQPSEAVRAPLFIFLSNPLVSLVYMTYCLTLTRRYTSVSYVLHPFTELCTQKLKNINKNPVITHQGRQRLENNDSAWVFVRDHSCVFVCAVSKISSEQVEGFLKKVINGCESVNSRWLLLPIKLSESTKGSNWVRCADIEVIMCVVVAGSPSQHILWGLHITQHLCLKLWR